MRISIALAATLMPIAAMAHTTPNGSDIVVTGRNPIERDEARAFVRQISVRADNQLARFHKPVCPLVIGMPAPYSTIIQDRIRETAKQVGIDVDEKVRCSADLIVVFADDGAAWVKQMRSSKPGWFEGVAGPDIDRLAKLGPVRAWNVTSLRNEDGRPIYTPPEGYGSVTSPLSGKPTLEILRPSLLQEPTRRDVEASFVVFDKPATIGLTLRQLADYAAMRGLAQTRPATDGNIGSILSLFDGDATKYPPELTSADIGYLKALYASKGYDRVTTERLKIAHSLANH